MNAALAIFKGFEVIWRFFRAFFAVIDEILEIIFFEEAMSVEALQKELIFADMIDEPATFTDQYCSNGLIGDIFKLFLGDVEWVDEDKGKALGEPVSEDEEIFDFSCDVLFK